MPGYGGTVQHEYNVVGSTYGKAAQEAYIKSINMKHHPQPPLQREEQYTANDYYSAQADPRRRTNSKNRSNLTLGDPRAQTFDTMHMTAYRGRDLPMTRAPLVDGFSEMSVAERDKVYRRALERCGVEGVRKLEHDIRVKIEQRTSGGPFALRKAFKYFDRDGSGDIDPDEFFAAMDWFGLQFTEDGVLGLFGLYDEDRGGSLGYYEFVENLIDGFGKSSPNNVKAHLATALEHTAYTPPKVQSPATVDEGLARRAFEICDKNNSGRIELSELDGLLRDLKISTDSDVVNQAMLTLDQDQSGDVSFEEFWTWWQTIPFPKSKSPHHKRGGVGDQGKKAREEPPTYKREELEMLSTGGRRSPWGMPKSPYGGGSKSPVLAAQVVESLKAQSPAKQYGDVLADGGSPPILGRPPLRYGGK